MASVRVKTQPICEPVGLTDLKAHLRVDISNDDNLIAIYAQAAREWCEGYTNQSFIKKTYEARLDWFPLFDYKQQGYTDGTAPRPSYYNGLWWADSLKIKLLFPPLISVTSIKYVDPDGTEQTLATNKYQVDIYTKPARVYPVSGSFWPWVQFNHPAAVTITYDAGMGDEPTIAADLAAWKVANAGYSAAAALAEETTLRQAAVPGYVKAAIMLLTAHLYEHRESVSDLNLKEVPQGVENLLSMYRVDDFCPTKG